MSDLKRVNEKIAEGVADGFQKIENGVVGAYNTNIHLKSRQATF